MREPEAGARGMQAWVLGPVELHIDGVALPLTGRIQRAVLAALLLRANHVVGYRELAEAAWGDAPPRTATAQLHAQISGLRALLRSHEAGSDVILTRSPGYLLRLQHEQLDLSVFDREVRDARQAWARNQAERAATGFRRALELWRGPALGNVEGSFAASESTRLEERRLTVLEERLEADLALGRSSVLVPELTSLVQRHPLRERLHELLMLAQYRCGRQAEALATYREARRVLVDQLGVEPGQRLRQVQQAILAGSPEVDLPVAEADEPSEEAGVAEVSTTPAQLPTGIPDFTGRGEHVATLLGWLRDDRQATSPLAHIAGQAGVGKTTLAVRAAHELTEHFADGQLHADLQGTEANPADPGHVLDRFLRALGVEGRAIPADMAERVALYRSRLAGRRVLLLLDNAANEAQVRPLLPGGGGSAVIVTSRGWLAGLAGAQLLHLDTLTPQQSVQLLSRVVGQDRVHAEPRAAERIGELCGQLPLAVRIAGARLATRPYRDLTQLAERLEDQRHRLDELRAGDLEVRASLTLSYDAVEPAAQRAFHRLGVLETEDFAAWAAAAVLECSQREAERVLEQLVNAQLVQTAYHDGLGQLRYRFHDLPRAYARERNEADEPPADREAALWRALCGWLSLARRANGAVLGSCHTSRSSVDPWQPEDGLLRQAEQSPMSWFDTERASLLAAIEQAATIGWPELAWELAHVMAAYLEIRGFFTDWQRSHYLALEVCRPAENHGGSGAMWRNLGWMHIVQDRPQESLRCLEKAWEAFSAAADRLGCASVRYCRGSVYRSHRREDDALSEFRMALGVYEEFDDLCGQAHAMHGIGVVQLQRGQLEEAESGFQQALRALRWARYTHGQARALLWLGVLYRAQYRTDEAARCYQQARELCERIGERQNRAYAQLGLGEIEARRQQHEEAIATLGQCQQDFAELADRYGQARTLGRLGRVHLERGELAAARECLPYALQLWEQLDQPLWRARALHSLGELQHAEGDSASARRSWDEALELYQQLGAREVKTVAKLLEQLAAGSDR